MCGRTDRILDDMLATGADALELDYKTDARLAHDRMKDRAVFIGNLDPSGVLALGTPGLVAAKTRELVAVFADTPRFVLNAGCAIPATTPPENVRAMIRAARGLEDVPHRRGVAGQLDVALTRHRAVPARARRRHRALPVDERRAHLLGLEPGLDEQVEVLRGNRAAASATG